MNYIMTWIFHSTAHVKCQLHFEWLEIYTLCKSELAKWLYLLQSCHSKWSSAGRRSGHRLLFYICCPPPQSHGHHHCALHCVTRETRRWGVPAVFTLWSFRGLNEEIKCVTGLTVGKVITIWKRQVEERVMQKQDFKHKHFWINTRTHSLTSGCPCWWCTNFLFAAMKKWVEWKRPVFVSTTSKETLKPGGKVLRWSPNWIVAGKLKWWKCQACQWAGSNRLDLIKQIKRGLTAALNENHST